MYLLFIRPDVWAGDIRFQSDVTRPLQITPGKTSTALFKACKVPPRSINLQQTSTVLAMHLHNLHSRTPDGQPSLTNLPIMFGRCLKDNPTESQHWTCYYRLSRAVKVSKMTTNTSTFPDLWENPKVERSILV